MRYSSVKRLVFAIVVLLVLAGGVWWYVSRKSVAVRNVLLISMDTCRADRLGCYGFSEIDTGNIDGLAREGVRFAHAVTPIPVTLPAHSSMLTGTYPPYHNVHDNLNYRFGRSNVTLADLLGGQGYITGAIISAFVLDPQFGLSQGFDSYNSTFIEPVGGEVGLERRGGEVSDLACEYLNKHRESPFFLFLHYYDPHADYSPPEPFASEYAEDPYAGEIAYTDHCIGRVISKLKELDLYESTLIIVVGDHGEGLGEHGESEHGYYIYQSTLRVPFIIRAPGEGKGIVVDDVVSLVDVAPTILSYLGIPIPDHMQGRDLSGYGRGKGVSENERYVYAESLWPTKYECNPLLGLIGRRYKYIETTRAELYDLQVDGDEKFSLTQKDAEMASFMRKELRELSAALVGCGAEGGQVELDEASIKMLESLGYVGGDSVSDELSFDSTKTDAKDLIEYAELAQQVTKLMSRKNWEEAEKTSRKMLLNWPELSNSRFQLVRVFSAASKHAQVIEHGLKYLNTTASRRDADAEATHLNENKPIGMAHDLVARAAYELGRYDLAKDQWTAALAIKADWPEVLNRLAATHYRQGEYSDAVTRWRECLKFDGNWAEVHNNLGGALCKQGEIKEAVAHLKKAANLKPDWREVIDMIVMLERRLVWQGKIEDYGRRIEDDPNDGDAQNELAKVYFQQGELGKAIAHWRQAARLQSDKYSILNNLAWVLATVEDDTLRDVDEAVLLAKAACELSKYEEPSVLDTLGVAYAAAGRFGEAVVAAEKGIALAEADQGKLVEEIQGRLELYRAGKAYVEK